MTAKAKPANSDVALSRSAGTDQNGVVLQRTTLKKAGGSLMMTIPARARDALQLSAGQEMMVAVDGERLILEPAKPTPPKYSLDELLAQCDFDAPYSDDERIWLDAEPVGRELL